MKSQSLLGAETQTCTLSLRFPPIETPLAVWRQHGSSLLTGRIKIQQELNTTPIFNSTCAYCTAGWRFPLKNNLGTAVVPRNDSVTMVTIKLSESNQYQISGKTEPSVLHSFDSRWMALFMNGPSGVILRCVLWHFYAKEAVKEKSVSQSGSQLAGTASHQLSAWAGLARSASEDRWTLNNGSDFSFSVFAESDSP